MLPKIYSWRRVFFCVGADFGVEGARQQILGRWWIGRWRGEIGDEGVPPSGNWKKHRIPLLQETNEEVGGSISHDPLPPEITHLPPIPRPCCGSGGIPFLQEAMRRWEDPRVGGIPRVGGCCGSGRNSTFDATTLLWKWE